GVGPTLAPLSDSGCALARVRFQTFRLKPLASQLAAMPAPIVPRPRSAMRCMRVLFQTLIEARRRAAGRTATLLHSQSVDTPKPAAGKASHEWRRSRRPGAFASM